MSLLERIYFFHSRIRDNRFPNSTDITREFEVSSATAHRDIVYLRDRLLAPLAFNQAKNGYFYTQKDFCLPFEDTPRIILLIGILNQLAAGTGLSELPEFQQLQKRLSALLSSEQKKIDHLLYCEWVEVESVDSAVFKGVITALLDEEMVHLGYRNVNGTETQRHVDPIKLVNYQGRWYLLGWCHLRRDRRMFHLSRISSLELTGTKISRDSEMDTEWLRESFGIFKGKTTFHASILLTGKAAEIVRHQHWHSAQQFTETDAGLLLTLPAADEREIMMKVLQFGADAQVVQPRFLRDKLRDEISRMSGMYDTTNR